MVTKIKKINNYQPKIIVILFGLMHSGKSTAIRFFRQCGFKSYCCDDFARRVVMTNQDQIKTILHHQALRTAIFTSGKTRKIINNLVWPHVYSLVNKVLSKDKSNNKIVIETIDPYGLATTLRRYKLSFCEVRRPIEAIRDSILSQPKNYLYEDKTWFEFLNYQAKNFDRPKQWRKSLLIVIDNQKKIKDLAAQVIRVVNQILKSVR